MSGRSGPHGPDRLEEVLREALAARADSVGAGDLRPARPPSPAGVPRRHRLHPAVLAAVGLAAVVAAAVFLVHGAADRSRGPSVVPAGPSASPSDGPRRPTASPGPGTAAPVPAPPPSGSRVEPPGPRFTGAAPR
ncbi:hypothetical protein SCATT_p16890 (plasmid) [Streptantibioticus cattleyicolor NRRL 8057 = DSM 46488]|uniref:Uncharacterized protein n=1 Tax=Streptantibioticus cattleyicolor (strain ATCC 35852 / DSM 46488 / JCM 4925 / NBRC 14057 / NRRL 8057) TaxID=1003195 RepID=F8JJR7_STREN|nr:hypothetical protein SCATT_p16890 [Streptantibioticus cattleyicolor NRRL 8057 = DSM 46488]CCB71083.1 protein of unknown function [Streptantibioticus cattleyicolor NRRL 8057 = DSM 46488]